MRLAAAAALLCGGCALINAATGGGATDAGIDGPPSDDSCACDGDTLVCPGRANMFCTDGCSMDGVAHCGVLVPSNGVDPDELTFVVSPFVTTASVTPGQSHDYVISTDTGEILDYGDGGYPSGTSTDVRASGSGAIGGIVFDPISDTISVLAVDHMSLAGNSTLIGMGSRALVILSRGDVDIQGDLDFSGGCSTADSTCAGPGGGVGGVVLNGPAQGCGPGGLGNGTDATGGGGGAMGAAGGAGGDFSVASLGGAGGDPSGCPDETLVPLVGGGGGGGSSAGSVGGGGGGAIQITSLSQITISSMAGATTAQITVSGAGGAAPFGADAGGAGGGAGGAILLEAPIVTVNAALSANGGGGSGGRITGPTADGQHGTVTTAQAAGGVGDGAGGNAGRGGFGGASAGAATQGLAGADGTGGGGGSVGRIRINSKNAPDTTGSSISPTASTGPLVAQ